MPAIGNQDNVPKKNRWTGYNKFFAETTIISEIPLPLDSIFVLVRKEPLS